MHSRFSRFATDAAGVTTDLDAPDPWAAFVPRIVVNVSATDADLSAEMSRAMLQRSHLWSV